MVPSEDSPLLAQGANGGKPFICDPVTCDQPERSGAQLYVVFAGLWLLIFCWSCVEVRSSGAKVERSVNRKEPIGWQLVCEVERRRSAAYLAGFDLGVSTPNQPFSSGMSQDIVLESIAALINARGTLCSPAYPCSVVRQTSRPTGHASKADLSGYGHGTFQICVPRLAEGNVARICEMGFALRKGPFMRKACLRGTARRCFRFNLHAIRRWVTHMRTHASRASATILQTPSHSGARAVAPFHRCAVVLSGHSLRCSRGRWRSLIDNRTYYAAVFRANNYPSTDLACSHVQGIVREADVSGVRTDFGFHGCRADHHDRAAQCPPRVCIEKSTIPQWTATVRAPQLLKQTGLGLAHSGGFLVDVAIAHCANVDVYGAGIFSKGPGFDAVVQHWYDPEFASEGCISECSVEGLPADNRKFYAAMSSDICRPNVSCSARQRADLPLSERQDDFFFLSELRNPILHAIGAINWVWYS